MAFALLLVHVPPEVTSLSVTVKPTQTSAGTGPVIGASTFTVVVVDALQPLPDEKVITVDPLPTPYTTPVSELIVAASGLLLLQVYGVKYSL